MKSTMKLLTLALLFSNGAEAQSIYHDYNGLMELQNEVSTLPEIQALNAVKADPRSMQELKSKSGKAPEVQSLTSQATSTVMSGMKQFTAQLEELIKNKMESFMTTELKEKADEESKKPKKKQHSKKAKKAEEPVEAEALNSESEDDLYEHEAEHHAEHSLQAALKKHEEVHKRVRKHMKHHKKVEESDSEEEEPEQPKHHRKHHKKVQKKEEKEDKKQKVSLEDLAGLVNKLIKDKEAPKTTEKQVKKETKKDKTPNIQMENLGAVQPKLSPEEILNRQAQMTQKKINDARLKVMNLKTALEDAVREVKELSEMQAMTEGEMLGLHERMLAKEQALDHKLQMDYQNNLAELERMRSQWANPHALSQLSHMMPSSDPTAPITMMDLNAKKAPSTPEEQVFADKREQALMQWYTNGRGRAASAGAGAGMQNLNESQMMQRKMKRAAKLKQRAQALSQLSGQPPSLANMRSMMGAQSMPRFPSQMMHQ